MMIIVNIMMMMIDDSGLGHGGWPAYLQPRRGRSPVPPSPHCPRPRPCQGGDINCQMIPGHVTPKSSV